MFIRSRDFQAARGSESWSMFVFCARLAQLVRSLTASQEVPGSIPGLVEGRTLGDPLSPHRPWTP